MSWLWLNVPLMVLFAAAIVGIPLCLVLRRPDFGPEPAGRPGEAVPATIAARYAEAGAHRTPHASRSADADVHRRVARQYALAGAHR